MIRLVYLARRNPELSHEAFVGRWRNHYRLAASMKEWGTVRKYLQCEVKHDRNNPPYDGMATVEYMTPDSRFANRGATEYHRILREDELRVFASHVSNFSCIATHEVVWGVGAAPAKIVRFLVKSGGLDAQTFMERWKGPYAEKVVNSVHGLIGYARNVPIAPEAGTSWGLKIDGAEELWFESEEAALAYANSAEAAALRASAAELVASVTEMVTDEVVLHDVGNG